MLAIHGIQTTKELTKKAKDIAKLSQCTKRKVGAIVTTHDYLMLGIGWNYNPESTSGGFCEHDDGTTKSSVIHAEVVAIENLSDSFSVPTIPPRLKIFVTHKPCKNCLQAIVNAGIEEVYVVGEEPTWVFKASSAILDKDYTHKEKGKQFTSLVDYKKGDK